VYIGYMQEVRLQMPVLLFLLPARLLLELSGDEWDWKLLSLRNELLASIENQV
jgi:hypothetical protein